MKRFLLAATLALAACHGQQGPGVTLDADEDARNATGAKIDADLAAADAAARKPLPTLAPARPTADTAEGQRDDDRQEDQPDAAERNDD